MADNTWTGLTSEADSRDSMAMFRPPINRAMHFLDRSFFQKEVPISAARILNNQRISNLRRELERAKDLLRLERTSVVRPDPDLAAQGKKCLLLKPEIKHDDTSTWGERLSELVRGEDVKIIPYALKLDYEYWTYHDIMTAILPEEDQGEVPTGFSIVGHIAHLNLREQYLPYKTLIANVLLDKNPTVTTVINKTDEVGTNSAYRTFGFEVLAGEPNLDVEVKEGGCTFRFDYSQVYWNSRLSTEHQRLVDIFEPGEAVCDVMAGVGPFAVPAGRRGVFVWANDLNPASYASLTDAITRNNVTPFVRAFNSDARTFLPSAINDLFSTSARTPNITLPSKPLPRHLRGTSAGPPPPRTIQLPRTFSHFVMNLPASATSFLDAFVGAYREHKALFHDGPEGLRLPMVHVHCFSTKSDDNTVEKEKICAEISARLGHGVTITPDTKDVKIWDVRDVAPLKRMFCASFRVPPEVAFADR